jgi:ketosteroid isomerase-like protein
MQRASTHAHTPSESCQRARDEGNAVRARSCAAYDGRDNGGDVVTSPTARRGVNSPQEMHRVFKERLESGDLDGIVALYEEGASMPDNTGQTVSGLDAIRQNMAGFVAMQARIAFQAPVVHQSGDIALVHAKWSAKGTGPDGPIELAGVTSEVVRRQPDGTWLYLIDDPGIGATSP